MATATALGVVLARDDLAAGLPFLDRAAEVWDQLPPVAAAAGYQRQFGRALYCATAEPWARAGLAARARMARERGLALAAVDVGEPTLEARTALAMCRAEGGRALELLGDRSARTELETAAAELESILDQLPASIDPYVAYEQVARQRADLERNDRCEVLEQVRQRWRSWSGGSTPFIKRRLQAIDRERDGCPDRATGSLSQ